MKTTIIPILVAMITCVAANMARAGGYHCQLKIHEFEFTSLNTVVLSVEKSAEDKEFYIQGLGDWEMVNEEVGAKFTVVFLLDKPVESSLRCLNHIIHAYKEGKEVEFGFGDTAIKADKNGQYVSTYLLSFHDTETGAPCIHGS